ncbi:TBC1 domain, member 5 [Actinomortierella ambigua]|uniref:TBC1 domain, member 5 n=1 Tax=Actinomortierella ambigua TaxID=1343610 RepID=A0A9P6U5H3_9FUNG|nr:TBC1 domain, member 5 [Actinomortierella ambigua]
MNTFQGARAKWLEIFGNPDTSLEALKARAISPAGDLGSDGIRSVCWKLYLSILPTLDLSSWPAILAKEREEYSELHRKFIRAVGSEDNIPNLEVNNPLSLAEDSPWQQFFVDSELKKVIRQDVERTFPDNDYFRSQKVQDQLTDILFIFCKIHHDVSYRQGMHELLAHMLWVVSSESLDVSDSAALTAPSDPIMDVMKNVLDSNYIAHDTFILFSRLMVAAKPWYEFSDEGLSSKKQRSLNMDPTLFGRPDTAETPGKPTPVIEWSMRIFHYLKRVDNELFNHLTSLEIQPQLFGIRWFRLLFGREFPMDDVLVLWDGIFSVDPGLKITTFIGLAMLIHIRDDLLESDFSMCLHKLMRYPPCKDVRNFIKQGIYLQAHPTAQGGMELIRQNYLIQGKPLPPLPPQHISHGDQARHSRDEDRSQSPHPQHHKQYPQHRDHHHERNHGRVQSGNGGGIVPHLPPSALEAIKPVTEGFAHVTKNVLESKGGAALNRAIHDMKKSTQSYIRKAGHNVSQHQQNAQSIFPPMFDQAVSSSARLAAQSRPLSTQPTKLPSSPHNSSQQQQPPNALNAQMGQVVAKAIAIFEAVLSQLPQEEPEDTTGGQPTTINTTPNVEFSAKGPAKAGLAALSGLEHVRDVLLGHSTDWNPLVIESAMLDPSEIQETSSVSASQQQQQLQQDPSGRGSPIQQYQQRAATASPSPSSSPRALQPSDTAVKNGRGISSSTSVLRGASPSPISYASRAGESSTVESAKKSSKDRPHHHHAASHGDARKHVTPSVSPPPPPPPTTVIAGVGTADTAVSVIPSPVVSAPTPTPIAKSPRPFSFDDLLAGDNDAGLSGSSDLSQQSPLLAGKGGHVHDDPLSKTKSPRSLLANSQFSWMVGSNGSSDSVLRSSSSSSGGGGSFPTSHRNASSTDVHQDGGSGASPHLLHPRASVDGLRGRMKLDPLAGAVTKPPSVAGGGTTAAGTGASLESLGSHAERTGHDPLQELST